MIFSLRTAISMHSKLQCKGFFSSGFSKNGVEFITLTACMNLNLMIIKIQVKRKCTTKILIADVTAVYTTLLVEKKIKARLLVIIMFNLESSILYLQQSHAQAKIVLKIWFYWPKSMSQICKLKFSQHHSRFKFNLTQEKLAEKTHLPESVCLTDKCQKQILNAQLLSQLSGINKKSNSFLRKKEFQQIFCMFKKFAKLTNYKSQQQIINTIKKDPKYLSNTNSLQQNQQIPQYFFSRSQFQTFLVELGFGLEEAQQFWQVAYNKSRFQPISGAYAKNHEQLISMRAFAYNYKKFYLDQTQNVSNCLSQPALRQRMIDLRLLLQPWFTSNIILKNNHKTWKIIQLKICQKLSELNQEKLYLKMIEMIDMRNKAWLFMRCLAKIFYLFTDQKNIGLDVFNQKITSLVNNTKQNLEIFNNFLCNFQTYLLAKDQNQNGQFKITELVEFANKNLDSSSTQKIVNYLRGLFKYLYFFNKSDLLHINTQTLNIDCRGIVQITYTDILEFLDYKHIQKDHFIETISSIYNQINQTVNSRPEISGHRRFISQCNYLAQTLLKMVKRCDFTAFYRLELIRNLLKNREINDLNQLKQLLDREDIQDQQISKQFWKRLFNFDSPNIPATFQQNTAEYNNLNDFQQALSSYKQLHQKLTGKYVKGQTKQKEVIKRKDFNATQSKQQNIVNKNIDSVKINSAGTITGVDQHHGVCYCSLCDSLCSTQMQKSLNKIDTMSSYLMGLLQDI